MQSVNSSVKTGIRIFIVVTEFALERWLTIS